MPRNEKTDITKQLFLLVIPLVLASLFLIFVPNHSSADDTAVPTTEPTVSSTPSDDPEVTPSPTATPTPEVTPTPTATPTNPPSPSLVREGTASSPSPLTRGEEEGLSSSGLVDSLITQVQDKIITPTTSSTVTQVSEEDTDIGKLVTVSAPNEDKDHPLTNVKVHTAIPEIYKVGEEGKIKINWQNNKDQSMQFTASDTDNNGKLDYVEWVVPHLSTQVFEIIFISKAFYLDQDKNIVDDIYDKVSTQDNQWSTINNNEYIRVTFNKVLDSSKDITVYAKTKSSKAKVEVYPVYTDQDGNQTEGQLITTFNNIDHEDTYKVLLTALQKETDTFDLKITGGSISFDYIVDPTGWLTGWAHRKKITIDNANVDADLTDFPTLVKFTSDADVGAFALSTSYDIRFTNSGGTTLLKYERESWTGGAGAAATANFWVKSDIDHDADTVIYMYYGKADATDGQDAVNVWDSSFVTVSHDGGLTSSVGVSGTNNGSTSTTGKFSTGRNFDGSGQYIEYGRINMNYATVSAWVKTSQNNANQGLMILNRDATLDTSQRVWQWGITVDSGGDGVARWIPFNNSGNAVGAAPGTVINNNAWHQITGTFDGSSVSAYVDGALDGTAGSLSGTLSNGNASLWIGKHTVYAGGVDYNGALDEVRISSTARSADWIKFEYNNMNSASNELTFATQENNLTWLSGWSYRKKITIDHTKVGATSEDETNFPVLISLTGLSNINTNGTDIRFTADDGGTFLAREIESYSSGTLVAWIKVPVLSHDYDTSIYMYYGNSSATEPAANSTYGSQNVWDSNYKGVYHLNDPTNPLDSTSNDRDGTNNGATATTGKSGGAGYFDGTDYITVSDTGFPNNNNTRTISVWVTTEANSSSNYYKNAFYYGTASQSQSVFFGIMTESIQNSFYVSNYGDRVYSSPGNVINDANWHNIVATYNGTTWALYTDGIADDLTGANSHPDQATSTVLTGSARIGADTLGNLWTGFIDETHVSSVARSAGWISTEYANQNSPSTFYSVVGTEEAENLDWLSGWSDRKKITIKKINVDEDLTDFPLLVKFASNADLSKALATGYDIRFTSSDGTTILPYERESWTGGNGTSATANFWVKIPSISTSVNTDIYVYYGKSDATDGADPTNVWDSNFKGVWHMAETGTNPTVYDSTSNNNDSTAQVWTPTTSGKVSGAGSFDGSQKVALPAINSNYFTISGWVKYSNLNAFEYIYGRDYGGSNRYVVLGKAGSGDGINKPYAVVWNTSNSLAEAYGPSVISTGQWYYLTFTYDGSNARIYQNAIVGDAPSLAGTAKTGSDVPYMCFENNSSLYLTGAEDELRISSSARSAGWIKFEYNNMNSSDNELIIEGASSTNGITWTNGSGDGLWSTAGNWQGGVVPATGDIAVFNSSATDNCAIDANISVKGINIVNGYTGTITQNATKTITVGTEGFVQASGTFTGADGGITLNGAYTLSGGTFNAGSQTITANNNWTYSSGTFDAQTSTVSLGGTWAGTIAVSGSQTFNNMNIGTGTCGMTYNIASSTVLTVGGTLNFDASCGDGAIDINTGTIAAQGNITIADSYTYRGSATILINGTGDQTFTGNGTSGSGAMPKININKNSGTLSLSGTIRTLNDWIYTSGTVNAGTSTVIFASVWENNIAISGSQTLYNASFEGCGSNYNIASDATLTVDGALTFTGTCPDGSVNINTGIIAAKGNITISSGYTFGGSAIFNLTGTANQTITSSGGDGTFRLSPTINKASGTVILASNLNLNYSGQDLTITSGTLDLNGKTLTVNDTLTIGASGILNTDNGSYTAGTTTNNGSIIDQRTWLGESDSNWNTAGNWSGGAVPGASQFVMFDERCGLQENNCNVTINANVSVLGVTLASTYTGIITQSSGVTISTGTWAQASGTFTGSSGNDAININLFTQSGGTYTATAGTFTLGRNTGWDIPTDYVFTVTGGTFNHNNGTIKFTGAANYGYYGTSVINVNESINFNNVTVEVWEGYMSLYGSVYSVASGDTVVVNGTFTQEAGAIGGTWNTKGNIAIGSHATGGEISLTGSTNTTYAYTSGGYGPGFIINKDSNSVTVTPASGTANLTIAKFTLTKGSFTAPTGTLNVSASGTSQTSFQISSGTAFNNNSGTMEFSGGGGSCSVGLTIDVDTSVTFNNVTENLGAPHGNCWNYYNSLSLASGDSAIVAGNFTQTSGYLNGNWTINGNATINSTANGGDASLTFSGTSNQSITNSGGANPAGTWIINKSSGAVTLANDLSLNSSGQDLTLTSGTLDLAGHNLTVNDVFSSASGTTLKLQGNETVTVGTKTLADNSNVEYTATSGTNTIQAWIYKNLIINGAGGTFNLPGDTTVATVNVAAGTLNLAGHNLSVAGDFTVTSTLALQGGETLTNPTLGTDSTVLYNATSGTRDIKEYSYHNLSINGTGGTFALPVGLTISDNLDIVAGTLKLAGKDLTVTGNFSNSGNLQLDNTETLNLTADTDSGTVTYTGTGIQTSWNYPGNNVFNNLTIDAVNGTYKLPADLTVNGNLTLTNGILDLNGFNLTVTGNIVRTNGTFANTAGRTLTLNGTNQEINTGDVSWHTVNVSSNVTAGSDVSVSNLLSIAISKSLSLVSHVWSLLGELINLGSINEGTGYLANSASVFAITDSSFNTDEEISMPGDKIYLSLTDQDANTDGANLNSVAVTVACSHDSEAVTLAETGIATEIFRNGGLSTATYDGSATEDDGTLECSNNDAITASYNDPQDSGDTATAHATATTDTKATAPSGLSGTAQSSTSIKWDWTDESNNESGFKLYSGTDTLIATINTAGTTTYTETGLTKGTAYTRKVVAYNGAGNSSFSSDASATTPAEPTAPSLLSGLSNTSTSIVWSWTDNSNDETGFKLLDSAGTVITTINNASQVSYTETGLTKGTSYTRKVVSFNDDGTSAVSNSSTVTTKTSALNAPVPQSPVNGASLSTLLPTFTFDIDPNEDSGIASYIVYIDDSAKYSFSALAQGSSATISGARVSSSSNSITVITTADLAEGYHTWKVRVIDAAGNTSDSAQRFFSLDITKPSVALTNTNLNISDVRPTFDLVLGDSRELSKVTFTIEKLTYLLGSEFSRKTVFTKTYDIDGTTKDLSVAPDVDLVPDKYILTMTVEDTAGNKTTSEKEFTILEQTNSEEISLIQAEPPKTAKEIKKIVEEGNTPTKVPEGFQIPNLEKQAIIRQIKQAANLDTYIQHFLPTNFFIAFNNSLEKIETGISSWGKNTGTRIAGLFKQGIASINKNFARSRFFASNSWKRFAGSFEPIVNTVNKNFVQSRYLAASSLQSTTGFLHSAQLNRLELATQSEEQLDRFANPLILVQRRVVLVARIGVDVFSGQQEQKLAITDVVASQLSSTSAQISWKTNRSTGGKINFGPSTMYGESIFVEDLTRDHVVDLKDLSPNTKYYFEVLATDVNNEQTYDAYYSFTTPQN